VTGPGTAAPTPTTALARVEQSADTGAQLTTVKDRKAFLEVASRADLDKLPPAQQRAVLIAFGQHTGLRAELGEVMIYQGRFYVTIGGRVRNAHRLGLFDGARAHPATMGDKRSAGYQEDDIVWWCEVWRRGSPRPFRGWGKVTRAEIDFARAGDKTKFTPIAKHPVEMARKRATYDALRLAFPLDEELSELSIRLIENAEVAAEATTPISDGSAEEIEAALEVTEEGAVGGKKRDMTEAESLELDAQQAALE